MSNVKFTLKSKEGKPDDSPGSFQQGTLTFKLKANNDLIKYMEESIRIALTHYNKEDE